VYQNWYIALVSGSRKGQPKLDCRFYRTAAGSEPVREWLKGLSMEAKKQIGSDIQAVQWRWPISRPLVASFGGGLYEVRSTADKVEYRVLFCIVDSIMVLLHGFAKKTQKTPKEEIDLAVARKKEI
jgi:phage-related protein